jgi:hypothetical protein
MFVPCVIAVRFIFGRFGLSPAHHVASQVNQNHFQRKCEVCLANRWIWVLIRLQPFRVVDRLPPQQTNMRRADGALLTLGQREAEKEGRSFRTAGRMNAAAETVG